MTSLSVDREGDFFQNVALITADLIPAQVLINRRLERGTTKVLSFPLNYTLELQYQGVYSVAVTCIFPSTFKLAWFWTTPDSPSKYPLSRTAEAVSRPPPERKNTSSLTTSPALRPLVMSRPPPPPSRLTPQFCFSQNSLRSFLRLSRGLIDDSINTNLNALITPSSTSPFDPSSTSTRSPNPQHSTIPQESCQSFIKDVLYPTWQARADVLKYCSSVATAPDPDDPEHVAREVYNRKGEERMVDERLDPYSGRFFPKEPRTEELARVLRQEMGVETIVRERSWGIVRNRCEGMEMGGRWEESMDRWREQQEKGSGR